MKFVLGLYSGIVKKICWHFYSFENSKTWCQSKWDV